MLCGNAEHYSSTWVIFFPFFYNLELAFNASPIIIFSGVSKIHNISDNNRLHVCPVTDIQ